MRRIKSQIDNLRWNFNERVREFGNEYLTPNFIKSTRYGVGDLLATDVNFRRAGATIGAVTPAAAMYASVLSDLEPLAAAIMAIPATPLVLIPGAIMGAFTGAIGYTAGTYLDALIGDENARGIIRDIKRDSDQGPEANNLPVSNGN